MIDSGIVAIPRVMCVLIFVWQPDRDVPLWLGANRDELRARPWSPPRWQAGSVPYLAPRDEGAGGTWLGFNARGLCVAITNGRGPEPQPDSPSRGDLVRSLLGLPDGRTAALELDRRLREAPFAGFHLLVADRREAFVHHHGDCDERTTVTPGPHVLTNRHDLDAELLAPVRVRVQDSLDRDPESLPTVIVDLLRDHRSWDETDYAICKHGEHYGTLSSALLTLGASPRLEFCSGPPCQGRFEPCPSLALGDDS